MPSGFYLSYIENLLWMLKKYFSYFIYYEYRSISKYALNIEHWL